MNLTVLTLIALWCGQPINSTKGAMGFKSGEDISLSEIKECRKTMIACYKSKVKFSSIDMPEECLKSP